jgi:hypothetical protein
MKMIFLTASLLLSGSAAQAANITSDTAVGPTITIEGQLMDGDDKIFRKVADSLPVDKNNPVYVYITGPGGSEVAAINIGNVIRSRGWNTYAYNVCTSACAIIWLAGTQAYSHDQALIGFHAASWTDGRGHRRSDGPGNAWLGKYYSDLGLNWSQITYLTQAPPESINWLSYEATQKYAFKNMAGLYPTNADIPALVLRYFLYEQQSPRQRTLLYPLATIESGHFAVQMM